MVDYTNTFAQMGAELRILRKFEAVKEHSKFSTNANYSPRLIEAAYSVSVDAEAIAAANDQVTLQGTVTSSIVSAFNTYLTQVKNALKGFFSVLGDELDITATDVSVGPIKGNYTISSGAVSIDSRSGFFGALRKAMVTDVQTIQKNTVTFGSLTALAGNVGLLIQSTAPAGDDNCLTGQLIIECSDDTPGAIKFRVSNDLTTERMDGSKEDAADNPMSLGQNFADVPVGLTALKLSRDAIAETGDGSAILSAHVVTLENGSDTDKGKIYVSITRSGTGAGTIWKVRCYSDSDRTVLVFDSAPTGGTDVSPVGITSTSNHSFVFNGGLTWALTFDKAAAHAGLPADGNSDTDIVVNLQLPRKGDRWKYSITNNEAGLFATKLARYFKGVSLPSGATPTITDSGAASVSMS